MIPITIRISLFLFCLVGKASFSQDSFFKKATILKSDSSQLEGFVERISEREISKALEYKESLGQKDPLVLLAPQIERLVFDEDSVVFEKVLFASRLKSDSGKAKEYRLAKKMVEGYATLYKMQLQSNETKIIHNNSNTFVYFLKIDTSFIVLDQIEKRIEPGDQELSNRNLSGYNYMVINHYKKELTRIFQGHPNLLSRVKRLKLKDGEMVSIITDFNSTHPEVPQKILREKDMDWITHGPVLGYTRFSTDAIGLFELGYQMHIVHPQLSERITHQLGFSLLKTLHSESRENEISAYGFKIPASSRFVFSKGSVSPFVGFGLSQYFGPSGIYGMLNAISGATLYKRMDVTIQVESLMPFIQYNSTVPTEKHLAIHFGYRFGT